MIQTHIVLLIRQEMCSYNLAVEIYSRPLQAYDFRRNVLGLTCMLMLSGALDLNYSEDLDY